MSEIIPCAQADLRHKAQPVCEAQGLARKAEQQIQVPYATFIHGKKSRRLQVRLDANEKSWFRRSCCSAYPDQAGNLSAKTRIRNIPVSAAFIFSSSAINESSEPLN